MTTIDITDQVDRAMNAPVEHEIDHVHDQLTDKELAAQWNAYRKRRQKLDLDSALLEAQIKNAKAHIGERHAVYIGDDGIAVWDDDAQPTLFSVQGPDS